MNTRLFTLLTAALLPAQTAWATIDAPYTLGRIVQESSHIVLMEVTRVNREKNLIVYKRVKDLKGTDPADEIKHNIGQRGPRAQDWQQIMAWVQEGKQAVFFYNEGASVTCLGGSWYQCYLEGAWWGLTHAEPYLLRTYCGDFEKLVATVTAIGKGQEVLVHCLADQPNLERYHRGEGRLQVVRASLQRLDYNMQRDFVESLGEHRQGALVKFVVLLEESSPGWKFQPLAIASAGGWRTAGYSDTAWRSGKAPLGYGEPEIGRRGGTQMVEQGEPFAFRRTFEIPAAMLESKNVTFRLLVASDDGATVYINGRRADADIETDHEYQYWNRDAVLDRSLLLAGRNLVAVEVPNTSNSSDLYLDVRIVAETPLPAKSDKTAK